MKQNMNQGNKTFVLIDFPTRQFGWIDSSVRHSISRQEILKLMMAFCSVLVFLHTQSGSYQIEVFICRHDKLLQNSTFSKNSNSTFLRIFVASTYINTSASTYYKHVILVFISLIYGRYSFYAIRMRKLKITPKNTSDL